jgi:hypothetical protein
MTLAAARRSSTSDSVLAQDTCGSYRGHLAHPGCAVGGTSITRPRGTWSRQAGSGESSESRSPRSNAPAPRFLPLVSGARPSAPRPAVVFPAVRGPGPLSPTIERVEGATGPGMPARVTSGGARISPAVQRVLDCLGRVMSRSASCASRSGPGRASRGRTPLGRLVCLRFTHGGD